MIGFERFHVAHAVVTGGASRSRAFLLTELARTLAEPDWPVPRDAVELRTAVARADGIRAAGGRLPRAIADPVGGSDRTFIETYEEIERMVGLIAARLFGAG